MADYATKELARTSNAVVGDTIAGIKILSIHLASGYRMEGTSFGGTQGASATAVDLGPLATRVTNLEAQKDSSFKTITIATLPANSSTIPTEVAALTGADAEEGDWVRAIVDGWALYYSRGATAWTEESREEMVIDPIKQYDAATVYAIGDQAKDALGYTYKALKAGTLPVMTGWDSADWELDSSHKQFYFSTIQNPQAPNDDDKFALKFMIDGVIGEVSATTPTGTFNVEFRIDGVAFRTITGAGASNVGLVTADMTAATNAFTKNQQGTLHVSNYSGVLTDIESTVAVRKKL